MSLSILVTGGTGFIGSTLVARLQYEGFHPIVLSRNVARARKTLPGIECIASLDDIPAERSVRAVVNLAGASVAGGLWTAAYRETLRRSRIETTGTLAGWLGTREQKPEALISASAIGFYGNRGDEDVTERSSGGRDFGADLCRDWEAAALEIEALDVRVVRLRIGLVLGRNGGLLRPLLRPLKLGLGMVMGNGRQWMSWIHMDDVIELIVTALSTPAMAGVYNATAPEPATNDMFMRTLGRVWHRPVLFRLPALPLRCLLGEMSEIFLEGQKVLPERAVAAGFRFTFTSLQAALEDIHG